MVEYGTMVEGINFFDMSKQVEPLKRFGHFELVVKEKISDGRSNITHQVLPWALTREVGAEGHFLQHAFDETDIGSNTPLYTAHQYAPQNIHGSVYEGRAIIVLNRHLIKGIESATRLTRKASEKIKRRKLRNYFFMVNPDEGMIIKGKGLTGQEIDFEIFWILPGHSFEEMFPDYLKNLSLGLQI